MPVKDNSINSSKGDSQQEAMPARQTELCYFSTFSYLGRSNPQLILPGDILTAPPKARANQVGDNGHKYLKLGFGITPTNFL